MSGGGKGLPVALVDVITRQQMANGPGAASPACRITAAHAESRASLGSCRCPRQLTMDDECWLAPDAEGQGLVGIVAQS